MTIIVLTEDMNRLFSYKSDHVPRIGDHLALQLDKYYLVTEVAYDISEDDDGKYCDSVEVLVR